MICGRICNGLLSVTIEVVICEQFCNGLLSVTIAVVISERIYNGLVILCHTGGDVPTDM